MHRRLFEEQLAEWPLASDNYRALSQVLTKEFRLDGIRFRLQCNPKRLKSSTADISKKVLQERPCFLCEKNRPTEQKGLPFEDFTILVNPFPVFPRHFTIANGHVPQSIRGRFGVFLRLARNMDDCVVFYNGPKCGASAPDHLHFQAGSKGHLPLESDFALWRPKGTHTVFSDERVRMSELRGLLRSGWLLEGNDEKALTVVFDRLLETLRLSSLSSEEEPMLNILCWFTDSEWHCIVLPRKAHRPSCYFREDAGKMLISPASVEMGGLMVAARLEDYERMDESNLLQILAEVSVDEKEVSVVSELFLKGWKEPLLEVGIVSAPELSFGFAVPYRMTDSAEDGKSYEGTYSVKLESNQIRFEDKRYDTLEFEPVSSEGARFELPMVKIGIGFHWERVEKQAFEGGLKFLLEGENITAVNRIPLESYLTSVISSEMSAKASAELLKAHAVISRSWLLAQIRQKGKNAGQITGFVETETERIRWYDREDHTLYDVCADDHCQRYQGITKAGTPQVRDAIRTTRGQVLTYGGEICDARFSKCCGGVMETFENCWENEPKPYLQGLADANAELWNSSGQKATKPTDIGMHTDPIQEEMHADLIQEEKNRMQTEPIQGEQNMMLASQTQEEQNRTGNQHLRVPDLRNEQTASDWILDTPPAFCHTTDKRILEQVLNNYDQETTDFFRWEKAYTTEEISRLAKERSGIDFGEIQELIPVERGVSGRIVRLKIVGSKRTVVLGKELEIRRIFSTSHLYSSAFVVEKTAEGFVLHGAGWGHGVGLCQIGAAVMGEQGYDYASILEHYYPNTELTNLYL
jgi:SpoIID/LytB domain protein